MFVASHLTDDLAAEALPAARGITDEGAKVRAISALAARLDAGVRPAALQEALEAARSIPDIRGRAEALAVLTPCLTGSDHEAVLLEAHRAACEIEDAADRAAALGSLVPSLMNSSVRKASGEWQTTVRVLARYGRSGLLSSLAALAPWPRELAGEQFCSHMSVAIAEVSRCWP